MGQEQEGRRLSRGSGDPGRGRAWRSSAAASIVAAAIATAACSGDAGPTSPGSTVAAAFGVVWQAFDTTYPYFTLKGANWAASRSQYEGRAMAAHDVAELNAILVEMLGALRDLHVTIEDPAGGRTPTWTPPYLRNFDGALWLRAISDYGWVQLRMNLGHARIEGVPYIAIGSWNSSQFSTADLDQALEAFRQDSVLIVDVRPNPGGNDQLALAFAGRFATQPILVERIRVRNGPGHDDFSTPVARTLEPRGPWTFTGRVYVLSGRGVSSSNESFVAAMRELPNVIVLGDTTLGATANPRPVEYYAGWRVWVSTWYATLPDGDPIEGRGIPPDVYVPFPTGSERDPVIDFAIARAREATTVARSP